MCSFPLGPASLFSPETRVPANRSESMHHITPIHFLQTIFGEPVGSLANPPHTKGQLMLWTRTRDHGTCYTYWPNNLDEAARKICRHRKSRDVFCGVTLHNRDHALKITQRRRPRATELHARGAEGSATLLPMLWATLDIAGPGNPRSDLPPTPEAALSVLPAVPKPPSIIIYTGTGFHLCWLLREPLLLATPEMRQRAKRLVMKVQAALRAAGVKHGWRFDQSSNLAHRLRVPGTLNHTCSPAAEVILEHFPVGLGTGDWRYAPEDFDSLPDPVTGDGVEALMRDPGAHREQLPDADFWRVFDGCPYLQYCYDQRTDLPEEEWEAALEIVTRCRIGHVGGRRLSHRFSRDHPGYTQAGTDASIDAALAAGDPRTCAQIGGLSTHAAACCAGCTHSGRIEAPIMLGRPATAEADQPALILLDPARNGVADNARNDIAGNDITGITGNEPPGDDLALGPGDDRPRILITTREHEVNDRALAVLVAREPNLFQQGGALVQLLPSPSSSLARVVPLTEARLRELLTRHCAFIKLTASGEPRPAHPPRWTVRAILSRGVWPQVPTLESSIEEPEPKSALKTTTSLASDILRDLVHGLGEMLQALGGVASSKEILDALATGANVNLRSSLAALFPTLDAEELPTPAQLSAKLSSLRDRIAGGAWIEQGARNYKGVRWRVRRVKEVS